VGGKAVTEVIDGRRRFQIAVRLPEAYRRDRDALGAILLAAPAGEQVPLARVADIRVASGPEVVNREDSQRRIVVQCNVRGRDIGSFVAEAQGRIQAAVELPTGYYITWGGQFENQQRAMRRLMLVLPAVLLVIFVLLFLTFHSAKQSFLVLLIVPFATVGGIAALWLRGMNLNVSASIGFIAVFGVAVLDGLVMVSTTNSLLGQGRPIREAIVEGAVTRLRPVLMTSVLASLGFLPMAIATSIGAEVQRPLATVVIGGLVSSTTLTLLLLPALYSWFLPKSKVADLERD
jgi:cobalt-zinc-cadmium resistance protein CzcA